MSASRTCSPSRPTRPGRSTPADSTPGTPDPVGGPERRSRPPRRRGTARRRCAPRRARRPGGHRRRWPEPASASPPGCPDRADRPARRGGRGAGCGSAGRSRPFRRGSAPALRESPVQLCGPQGGRQRRLPLPAGGPVDVAEHAVDHGPAGEGEPCGASAGRHRRATRRRGRRPRCWPAGSTTRSAEPPRDGDRLLAAGRAGQQVLEGGAGVAAVPARGREGLDLPGDAPPPQRRGRDTEHLARLVRPRARPPGPRRGGGCWSSSTPSGREVGVRPGQHVVLVALAQYACWWQTAQAVVLPAAVTDFAWL